ncbi:NAF1 domain-containing protein [Colletotrichum plurivorum]|uniref:H/ACA ribonucleoprotein complex non-core subunit NAF1 n=1 Tax=Colletotrichum plurivorum TaxID=2175906 RepID=A0A8H6JAP1_9PEZI|nr:NAF1 domain-containing protein [Colletotrichum plurivorum]
MSGFQIPGLGFAKPNETLPPLPSDAPATAASVEGVETAKNDAGNTNDDKQTPAQNEDTKMEDEPALPELPMPSAHEPMSIDAAEPPSLTDALEAMINGLDPTPPAPQNAVAATEQPEPTTTEVVAPAAAPEAAAIGAATAAPAPATEQQPAGEGEHPEWEVDSSPYESSSDSSSESSSDDDSESGEGYQLLGVEETARLLMEMDNASDDEGENTKAGAGQVRTKNEMLPEVIKPDVTLTPEDNIEALGAVDQIVDNIMVIKAFTPGEYQVLDSGSALCTEDRKVFGAVWETIGKVVQPMYTVMFNSAEEIKEAGLVVGSKVWYPTAHASFVFTEPLKGLKGTDASNIHDEELAEEEMEFSDDEKEAEHKRQIKQKKKNARSERQGQNPKPHPLRNETGAGSSATGALNYDDDEEGPYKPLARPPGFGQVPPTQQSYGEEPEPRRFGSRRGGRGDFRGRGDRGRDRGRGRGGYSQRDSRDGYSMPQQRPQQSQQAQGQWGGNHQPPAQSAPPPTASAFNFPIPFPGMPPPPGQGFPAVPPPPPPGWPAQDGQAGQPPAGAYINPAFFAALIGQMQAQQQPQQPGQNQQQQQQQPPPQQPPNQWGAQQQPPR